MLAPLLLFIVFLTLLLSSLSSSGLYAGIKFFIIDFLFKSCPKLRDKYDTPYIVWNSLPTDPQLKERTNATVSRRVGRNKHIEICISSLLFVFLYSLLFTDSCFLYLTLKPWHIRKKTHTDHSTQLSLKLEKICSKCMRIICYPTFLFKQSLLLIRKAKVDQVYTYRGLTVVSQIFKQLLHWYHWHPVEIYTCFVKKFCELRLVLCNYQIN